jgi:hypothetical protein
LWPGAEEVATMAGAAPGESPVFVTKLLGERVCVCVRVCACEFSLISRSLAPCAYACACSCFTPRLPLPEFTDKAHDSVLAVQRVHRSLASGSQQLLSCVPLHLISIFFAVARFGQLLSTTPAAFDSRHTGHQAISHQPASQPAARTYATVPTRTDIYIDPRLNSRFHIHADAHPTSTHTHTHSHTRHVARHGVPSHRSDGRGRDEQPPHQVGSEGRDVHRDGR